MAAGQQAENLLDFGDDDVAGASESGGLAATVNIATTPVAASFQTSANPLDDLVSIFGSTGLGGGQQPMLATGPPPLASLGMGNGLTPAKPTAQSQSQSEDLLGLF